VRGDQLADADGIVNYHDSFVGHYHSLPGPAWVRSDRGSHMPLAKAR